jgi:ParB family transcriptional regulator, chromosome partitioning protein
MAGLTEVPAIIQDLSDEQVKEQQLTENLQREDPHPLEEAEAIGQLQTRYKTIDEIAARLGKSRVFIYGRIRLPDLIPDIREMFIAVVFIRSKRFT